MQKLLSSEYTVLSGYVPNRLFKLIIWSSGYFDSNIMYFFLNRSICIFQVPIQIKEEEGVKHTHDFKHWNWKKNLNLTVTWLEEDG